MSRSIWVKEKAPRSAEEIIDEAGRSGNPKRLTANLIPFG
jgi:hypothetical protein